jgi:hypothetical protein
MNEKTEYKNILFYLKNELSLEKGDLINGSIAVRRSKFSSGLDMKFSFHLIEEKEIYNYRNNGNDNEENKYKNFYQLYKLKY